MELPIRRIKIMGPFNYFPVLCSDYYEQLGTFSSDKVKYGIFIERTDGSYYKCHLAINVEFRYTKICLKTLFMHLFSSKKLTLSDVTLPVTDI